MRLAVDATLRAAAPYQKSRRERATASGQKLRPVYVDQSDMRRWVPALGDCACVTNRLLASLFSAIS